MVVLKAYFVIDEFVKKFENRYFFTIDDLCIFGLFRTKYAARKALNNGQISFVQISKRRRVIPRLALFDYLRNNHSENLYK